MFKLIIVTLIFILLFGTISAGRSVVNPMGRSVDRTGTITPSNTTEETPIIQQPKTEDPLREENNNYISRLMNSDLPLTEKQEVITPSESRIENKTNSAEDFVKSNMDLFLFYSAGIILVIIFLIIIGWLKSGGSGI